MTQWRIVKWSREEGRGLIESPSMGSLPFDAAVADTDDFTIGESVNVQLRPYAQGFRVARIAPDIPRATRSASKSAPPLSPERMEHLRHAMQDMQVWLDYRISRLDAEQLVLDGDNDNFSYGPAAQIVFCRPLYVELPLQFAGKHFSFALPDERNYLATRVELTANDATLRMIDEAGRVYFVVAESVTYRIIR